MLALTLPLATLLAAPTPLQDDARFAEPVLLTEDGAPLGRGLLYPSPALYDVDADGDDELIAGDLFGYLYVFERLDGDDTLAWGEREKLAGRDGEDLKFNNW